MNDSLKLTDFLADPPAHAQEFGARLKDARERVGMGITELSRITRIPVASLANMEAGAFERLPGEVFARGFLRAYARAVGICDASVLRAHALLQGKGPATEEPPRSLPSPAVLGSGGSQAQGRFGVAIALVLLVILFAVALSIALKPRGRDVPTELAELPQPLLLALPA
jgi:cytoskeletal protein RodZ